jgi:hypothetical protein
VSVCSADVKCLDIAKIQGSPTYKAYMLATQYDQERLVPGSFKSARYCPFSLQICQYWPFRYLQASNPLAPMLKALVAAADATLETSTRSVVVSSYDLSIPSVKGNVQSGLKEVGVDGRNRLEHVARSIAVTIGMEGNCSDAYGMFPEDPNYYADPPQLVLTVEYTRDSMATLLWEEDCGYHSALNRLGSGKLGYDAVLECREEAGEDDTSCSDTLKNAFRQVSTVRGLVKNEEIGAVLVFGEQAGDIFMGTALREFLEEKYPNGASVNISHAADLSPNPAFAGSRVMAMTDWRIRDHMRERAEKGYGPGDEL